MEKYTPKKTNPESNQPFRPEAADSFCKEPNSKYFRLGGPHSLCCQLFNSAAVAGQHHRPSADEGARQRPNETPFTKTGLGGTGRKGCSSPTLVLSRPRGSESYGANLQETQEYVT